MELSLRSKVVLAMTLVAGVGAGVYMLWRHRESDAGADAGSTDAVSPRAARKPRKKQRSPKAASVESSEAPIDVNDVVTKCDLPLQEIQAFDAGTKEQVFYGLLMLGERHMDARDGNARAVEYFAKAAAIVPNPAEVLSAFEQTLPRDVFSALLVRIQEDIQRRVGDYFATVLPAPARKLVSFSEDEARRHAPVAACDIALGTTLWTETADIAVPLSGAWTEAKGVFPSDTELDEAVARSPDAADARAELARHCADTGSAVPLLLMYYLSMLLREESSGSGPSASFAHYDHLRPHADYRPGNADVREATLLRRILEPVNANVTSFLVNEIYAMMKSTLATNALAVASSAGAPPVSVDSASTRVLAETADTLALFHCAAHLAHACTANVSLAYDAGKHALTVSAARDIKAGEALTMAYMPFAADSSPARRRAPLMRVFGIDCACPSCL